MAGFAAEIVTDKIKAKAQSFRERSGDEPFSDKDLQKTLEPYRMILRLLAVAR